MVVGFNISMYRHSLDVTCNVSTSFTFINLENMALFKNKYRIDSTRLTSWNYNGEGMYFVTICTKNREHFFGECKDKKMKLSSIGALIQGFWYQIPKHFPHVTLGEFIVMPNHIME
jgi:hypothetical protein